MLDTRSDPYQVETALVCADDAEAIEKAKRLADGHDVELWSGPRLVILLSHKPE
jgi:hypothetical protein